MEKTEGQFHQPRTLGESGPESSSSSEKETQWEAEQEMTMLEEVRRSPFLRSMVIGMGMWITGMGIFEGFKLNEYLNLKEKKGKIERNIREIDPSGRIQKVREIYGSLAELDYERYSLLQKSLEQTEEQLKHFPWLGEVREVRLPEENEMVIKEKEEMSLTLETLPSRSFSGESGKFELQEVTLDTVFLRSILEKTYPRNWFKGEVSAIGFSKKTQELGTHYGIPDGKAWANFNRNTKKITFYEPAQQHFIFENVSECLAHELGHANDWESDDDVSLEDKAALLLEVTERLEREDRYESSYVESIENDNPQLKKYLKATEYWGEICAAYFRSPESMNYKDFKLVNDWVRKNDPKFDITKANDQRISMINRYSARRGM